MNNESSEILRILNSAFDSYARCPALDLYPEAERAQIDEINAWVYRRARLMPLQVLQSASAEPRCVRLCVALSFGGERSGSRRGSLSCAPHLQPGAYTVPATIA